MWHLKDSQGNWALQRALVKLCKNVSNPADADHLLVENSFVIWTIAFDRLELHEQLFECVTPLFRRRSQLAGEPLQGQ